MRKSNVGFGSLLTLAFLLAGPAHAAKFSNQFIEFELPPQWQCNLEGAEWVCQNTNEAKKKDAIIVLAAKLKGEQDSLDQYLTYLKSAKTYTSVQGKTVKSEVKYAKTISLSGQPWVDGLHLESEIPGFFTRYLATVKSDIGVLITYSVNKSKWQEYVSDFDALVQTLKVFRKPGSVNLQPADANLFKQNIPTDIGQGAVFPTDQIQGGGDEKAPPTKQDDNSLLFILGGAAVVLFLIWRKRRGG
jgi:hypothetical protein